MEYERIVELAQAIVNQKVANYSKDELGPLLRDLQATLSKFCDSFCDWLLMERCRFSFIVDEGPGDSLDLRVLLYFPLPSDALINIDMEISTTEPDKAAQDE